MDYKVRKGVETPCKIQGFLVRDFYILLAYSVVTGTTLLLEVKSWFENTESLQGVLLVALFLFVGFAFLVRKFTKNAKKKKYKTNKESYTLSNRSLFKKKIQ